MCETKNGMTQKENNVKTDNETGVKNSDNIKTEQSPPSDNSTTGQSSSLPNTNNDPSVQKTTVNAPTLADANVKVDQDEKLKSLEQAVAALTLQLQNKQAYENQQNFGNISRIIISEDKPQTNTVLT